MDHGWMDSGNGYYYVGSGIGIFLLIIILICIVWALQWPSCNGDPYGGGGGYSMYPYYSRVPCDMDNGGPPRVCAVSIDSRYVEEVGRGRPGSEGRGRPSAPSAVVIGSPLPV